MLLKIIMTLVLIGSAIVGVLVAREEEESRVATALGAVCGIIAGGFVDLALYAIWS